MIEQAGRFLTIDSPLGPNGLILTGFEGSEEMSRLFQFRLRVVSQDERIDPAKLLGQNLSFHVNGADGERRSFNGIVKSLTGGGLWSRDYREYEVEIVPWLWFLTRTTDLRIFQALSVPKIVEQIFSDLGFSDYDTSGISGQYGQREYCVQYRESDFEFVSRLLEEEGIYYYFSHESGRHRMVLADRPSGWYDSPDSEVEFRPNADVVRHVSEWTSRHEFRTGRWTQRDWNFEKPGAPLESSTNTKLSLGSFKKYEIYDYPGRFATKADGDALSLARIQAHEAEHHVVEGAGDCSGFSPGARFKLIRHDVAQESGGTYVVTSVRHSAIDPTHSAGEGDTPEYRNRFSCVKSDIAWSPPSVTPKPVVRGPQTAIVVGPAGEEIHTDKYGRVKVQFHWDREGKKDEKSSCWVRVAQSWAGKQWGSIFLPRIGMEVVVDFLEGDPDRPLITGAVYNADNMPPYGLPANKTQSGLKTRSSTGGGAADYNELRFEDKKGSEQVYVHAQKDFERMVENDDTLEVGNDQTNKIVNNRTETIEKGDEELTIKQGNRKETISLGNDELTIKTGNRKVKVSLGSSALEAMQKIKLKVGQSSIVLDQAGVTIKGMMVKVEGSVMTTVEGKAMLTLKGGLTMIN